ncbi:Condensin-2 complex subunit H2, partial [Struthio camelus australis]
GAAGPDDDDNCEDDLPVVPEDNVEMTPAVDEHIEPQRVGLGRGSVEAMQLPCSLPPPRSLAALCTMFICVCFLRQEMLDPWQSLDPFGDSEDKPFKKGRPFVVPHGLDEVAGSKRKRKGPRKLQDFMKWFSATYNNVADGKKNRRKGPTFADLEVLYWKQLKERFAAQRKLQ